MNYPYRTRTRQAHAIRSTFSTAFYLGISFLVVACVVAAFLIAVRPVGAEETQQPQVCTEERTEEVTIYGDVIEKEVRGVIQTRSSLGWRTTGSFDWIDWPGAGPLEDDGRSRGPGPHSSIFNQTGSSRGDTRYKSTEYRYVVVGQYVVEVVTEVVTVEVPCPEPEPEPEPEPTTTLGPAPSTEAPEPSIAPPPPAGWEGEPTEIPREDIEEAAEDLLTEAEAQAPPAQALPADPRFTG